MGEGILYYGLRSSKSRFTNDLQSFAKQVLGKGQGRGSYYVFGKTNKRIIDELRKSGVNIRSTKTAIADKTILKYINHSKKAKGAVVDFNRFRMVQNAVNHPKNIYIDLHRNRLIFVTSKKYVKGKVIKVVIDPNKRIRKGHFNVVTSIGVVDRDKMNDPIYKKNKIGAFAPMWIG